MISQNIFLELSKKVQNLGFQQSLIEISKIAMEEMGINRVTVWSYSDNHTINCRFKTDNLTKNFDCGNIIDLNSYPTYLKSLLAEKIIIANDVFTNSYTFEIKDYFKANNIHSTLDIPIFVDGLLFGIVCFENTGENHFWSLDDVRFGTDVSQIISIAYISSKRNEDIEKLNAYAERIKIHNIDLQDVIRKKNEQFIEYGFINSHLLNAPLSRLKGLMNILVFELNGERRDTEINFIIEKIYDAYDEMDKVVKQITVLVQKGADIDRGDIVID